MRRTHLLAHSIIRTSFEVCGVSECKRHSDDVSVRPSVCLSVCHIGVHCIETASHIVKKSVMNFSFSMTAFLTEGRLYAPEAVT